MGIDGIGSSVIIALSAVLWFLYLVPTWFRRREYLATERNAVRLQQTVRIMAESAEIPEPVRVAVDARSVAEQRKALRRMQAAPRYRRSSPMSVDSGARGYYSTPVGASISDARKAARRLRRSRAITSLVLLAALVACGFGVWTVLTGGSWLLLVSSALIVIGCFALLQQAASVAKARAQLRPVAVAPAVGRGIYDEADYAAPRRRAWTPVPVPRPLYLRESDTVVVPSAGVNPVDFESVEESAVQPRRVAEHVSLLQAVEEAERALRLAQAEREVTRIDSRPAASDRVPVRTREQALAESRYARMGIIEPSTGTGPDLDEILRRRRAAG